MKNYKIFLNECVGGDYNFLSIIKSDFIGFDNKYRIFSQFIESHLNLFYNNRNDIDKKLLLKLTFKYLLDDVNKFSLKEKIFQNFLSLINDSNYLEFENDIKKYLNYFDEDTKKETLRVLEAYRYLVSIRNSDIILINLEDFISLVFFQLDLANKDICKNILGEYYFIPNDSMYLLNKRLKIINIIHDKFYKEFSKIEMIKKLFVTLSVESMSLSDRKFLASNIVKTLNQLDYDELIQLKVFFKFYKNLLKEGLKYQ